MSNYFISDATHWQADIVKPFYETEIGYILVATNVVSKRVMCEPATSRSAEDIAKALRKIVCTNGGANRICINENEDGLCQEVNGRLCNWLDIRQQELITVYHMNSGDNNEWFNNSFCSQLNECLGRRDSVDWKEKIDKCLFKYNSQVKKNTAQIVSPVNESGEICQSFIKDKVKVEQI